MKSWDLSLYFDRESWERGRKERILEVLCWIRDKEMEPVWPFQGKKGNTNVNVLYRDTGHVIEKLKKQKTCIVFGGLEGYGPNKREKRKRKKKVDTRSLQSIFIFRKRKISFVDSGMIGLNFLFEADTQFQFFCWIK
jgi:hypothetical protein